MGLLNLTCEYGDRVLTLDLLVPRSEGGTTQTWFLDYAYTLSSDVDALDKLIDQAVSQILDYLIETDFQVSDDGTTLPEVSSVELVPVYKELAELNLEAMTAAALGRTKKTLTFELEGVSAPVELRVMAVRMRRRNAVRICYQAVETMTNIPMTVWIPNAMSELPQVLSQAIHERFFSSQYMTPFFYRLGASTSWTKKADN